MSPPEGPHEAPPAAPPSPASARAEGVAEAERCVAFLEAMQQSSGAAAARKDGRDLAEEFWHVLRR